MRNVLKNYILYMTAWGEENHPSLPLSTVFNIVSHLLYCNGNGTKWLDLLKGDDHLTMQAELKLAEKTGRLNFPLCNNPEKSINYTPKTLGGGIGYAPHEDFLENYATPLALKADPKLENLLLDDLQFWKNKVWENYHTAVDCARKNPVVWKSLQKKPEFTPLGFPYDFNRSISRAHRRYIPILNLLDFSQEHKITHNSEILNLTSLINTAVIEVYSEIIDSKIEQEILGEDLISGLRNRLNHFMCFHSQNFLGVVF